MEDFAMQTPVEFLCLFHYNGIVLYGNSRREGAHQLLDNPWTDRQAYNGIPDHNLYWKDWRVESNITKLCSYSTLLLCGLI